MGGVWGDVSVRTEGNLNPASQAKGRPYGGDGATEASAGGVQDNTGGGELNERIVRREAGKNSQKRLADKEEK